MNRLHLLHLPWLLCVSLLTAVLAASCTSTHDTADVIPPLPGAFQPDGGGALIDEAAACAQMTDAESKARAALGCDKMKRDCPAYIRPAGGADCFVYDQASVQGCVDLYDSFTSCDNFEQRPCLVTAKSNCDEPGPDSGAAGASAAGGQSGAGGEPGVPGDVGGAPGAGSAG